MSSPDDDTSITEPLRESRPNRLNQALAWVGIVAGGLFIVAAIFFAGFFLSWWSTGGNGHDHMGPSKMACCSEMKPGEQMMKPDEHMKPGAIQMTPGEMMPGGMMGPAVHSPATAAPSTPR
jgi:hypothetical protein